MGLQPFIPTKRISLQAFRALYEDCCMDHRVYDSDYGTRQAEPIGFAWLSGYEQYEGATPQQPLTAPGALTAFSHRLLQSGFCRGQTAYEALRDLLATSGPYL